MFDIGLGPYVDLAASGAVSLTNTACAVDDALGGKIRPGKMFHQTFDGYRWIIQHGDRGVDDFGNIMRRNVCRHADRNTSTTIDQQIRNA